MKVLCLIGARGGSKGLPGKNIKEILGKPLIVWTIENALATPEIDRVVVTTDSKEIINIAKKAGAECPFIRPSELSNSKIGKFQVWKHALNECEKFYDEEYEIVVDLDCTNPLRESEDISKALKQYRVSKKRGVDAVFSVCEARKNPYFNLVEEDNKGALKMSKSMPITVIRRQDAPKVYEHVASIYILDPAFIKLKTHLLSGHAEGYDIGVEKSLDIDSESDFHLVEYLMRKKYE
jgi:CMP-N,N'-diacetyllegionaminic acid synthase